MGVLSWSLTEKHATKTFSRVATTMAMVYLIVILALTGCGLGDDSYTPPQAGYSQPTGSYNPPRVGLTKPLPQDTDTTLLHTMLQSATHPMMTAASLTCLRLERSFHCSLQSSLQSSWLSY